MWLCSEHRLGRVGGTKWSAYVAAAAFFALTATLRVQAVFAVVAVITLFLTGEEMERIQRVGGGWVGES